MITPQLGCNYPFEIFDKISYYLTCRQKGVCRNVCIFWKNMFTPSLYSHVELRGRRQFQQFFQSLLSGMVGHYVRRLSVNDALMTAQELEALSVLCPNLVHLSFDGIEAVQDFSFSQWKYLRRLTENQDFKVTKQLLCAPDSTLSSLTHLSLRFSSSEVKINFLKSIYKLNDLEFLSLDSVTLSVSELEMIHDACPNIQKIRLTNADLEPIGATVEEKRLAASHRYKPAKCMKILQFQNITHLYENYEWLYYLASKYIYLDSLELWCKYSVSTPSPEVAPTASELKKRYAALAGIGLNCCSLKSLNLMNVAMNPWLFEAMDHVGTRLDSISLGDMTDMTIDMLQCLVKSKQNVLSLTLWGWPSLCIQETMQETIILLGMCSDRLSSIHISMQFSGIKNAPIPIDLILRHCINLKQLKFDHIQAVLTMPVNEKRDDASADCHDMPKKSELQHIILENGSFRNQVFEYLSLYCPALNQLEISSCSLIGQSRSEMDIKIHMPCHTFQSIRIDHARAPSQYYQVKKATDITLFDVVRTKKNMRQLYALNKYESYTSSFAFNYEQKTVEYCRPTSYTGQQDVFQSSGPFVYIICRDLIELHIGSLWVI